MTGAAVVGVRWGPAPIQLTNPSAEADLRVLEITSTEPALQIAVPEPESWCRSGQAVGVPIPCVPASGSSLALVSLFCACPTLR